MGDVRFLANRLLVQVHEPAGTGFVRDDFRVTLSIAGDGHIDVEHSPALGRRDVRERLVELGLAEWKQVGREDSEQFVTDRFRQALGLTALGLPGRTAHHLGWQDWTPES